MGDLQAKTEFITQLFELNGWTPANFDDEDTEILYQLCHNDVLSGLDHDNSEMYIHFGLYYSFNKKWYQLGISKTEITQKIPDRSKQFLCFQKAVDVQNESAFAHLAICYKNGYGVNVDIPKSRKLLEKSVELGCRYGMCLLGCQLFDTDPRQAVVLLKKSATLGNLVAASHLLKYYLKDVDDIDPQECAKYALMLQNDDDEDQRFIEFMDLVEEDITFATLVENAITQLEMQQQINAQFLFAVNCIIPTTTNLLPELCDVILLYASSTTDQDHSSEYYTNLKRRVAEHGSEKWRCNKLKTT